MVLERRLDFGSVVFHVGFRRSDASDRQTVASGSNEMTSRYRHQGPRLFLPVPADMVAPASISEALVLRFEGGIR